MSGPVLRVVSYNIHSQRDDPEALVGVVRGLAPDVLLVQEAPRRFRWRHKCSELARSFGLYVAEGGLPALGNLVLTDLRVQIGRSRCVRFPLTPGRHMRGAALVECAVAGVPFAVVGTHLGTDAGERPAHARLLRAALADLRGPVIVGADLNDEPGGPAWSVLAGGLVDAAAAVAVPAGGGPGVAVRPVPTYSCADPRRRIDAIFTDPRIAVEAYRVVDTPAARRASDHFPVVADLRLPA